MKRIFTFALLLSSIYLFGIFISQCCSAGTVTTLETQGQNNIERRSLQNEPANLNVSLTLFQSIGISVASSFIVLVIIAFSKIIWGYYLENLFLKLSNRHMRDISGIWEAEYTDSSSNKCTDHIEIIQYGWKIKGKQDYTIKHKSVGNETHKTFEFEGYFDNDMLTVFFRNTDRRQKGGGTYTLGLKNQGDVLDGGFAWWDVENDKIETGPSKWIRKNKCG